MPKRALALLPLTAKRLPTRKKSPPPLYVTTPPSRAGGNTVPASTGGKDRSLARRNGRPLGSTKQSPAFQEHRLGNALDREPALTRDNRIAFDSIVLVRELDRP